MNTKKLLTIVLLLLAVFITAKAALGDISVTSTAPTSAVETVAYTYDVNAIDNDVLPEEVGLVEQFSVVPVGFTPVGAFLINASTGLFTWTPGQGDAGIRQFEVTIVDNNLSPVDPADVDAPVTHLFTINVADDVAPAVSVSDILFNEVDRGNNVTATVTVTNTGNTAALTGVSSQLLNVNARYQASVIGTLPTAIAPGASATVQLQVFIPLSEDSGSHTIGTLSVTSDQGSQVKNVVINPKSYLTIDRIRINDDSSGELSLEDVNTFDVKVSNDYTEDMENVVVTVKILNVDGDDLKEESEDFEINNGDNEEITVEFDLGGEAIDEDSYDVEITVEGEDTQDGSKHIATEQLNVDVDRESHKIVIRSASITNNIVESSGATEAAVKVENIGKHDEDNVEIRIRNSALGIDMRKNSIDLDKASGSDNEYKARFNIHLQDAKEGTYALVVEVLRDGEVDDTEELSIEVTNSLGEAITGNTVVADNAASDQLKEQLLTQLQQRQNVPTTTETPLRDSEPYLYLLGGLTALIFIAVVLAVGVLVVRKRR